MRRLTVLRSVLALGLALFCVPAAPADEVRLKDGTVLVGKVRIKDDVVQITTRDGARRVPLADVARIRDDATLRGELDQLAKRAGSSAHKHLEIARQARVWGLVRAMWSHLDDAIENRPENGGATSRRIDDFLAVLEPDILPPHVQRGGVEKRVRELLYRVRPGARKSLVAAVEVILARLDDADAAQHLRRRARGASSKSQRLAALRAVDRRAEAGSHEFVYRTGILDSSSEVRRDAMGIVSGDGRAPEAVRYLAPGLVSQNPHVRMRTARAYEALGDVNAAPLLVRAGPLASAASLPGGSVRGHVAFLNQQAYVRDFDVEVAQASFIADPKIDVVQSGVVLDATVHAVVTMRRQIVDSYRGALRRLVGADPGPRTSRWADWYAKLDAQPGLPELGATADLPVTSGARPRRPTLGTPGPSGPVRVPGLRRPTPGVDCPTPGGGGTYLPGDGPIPGRVIPRPAVPKGVRDLPAGGPGVRPTPRPPSPAVGRPAIVRPGGYPPRR